MLIESSPSVRKRPARERANMTRPVLVDGTFDDEETLLLTLAFDQPIALASFDAAAFGVDDARTGASYRGTGVATILDPRTVRLAVAVVGGSTGTAILLTAGDATSIVARSGGLPWAGVGGFALSLPK
jgi:hypothetical protein